MKNNKIYDISVIAMFLVFLIITSKITFYITIIPFTLQTFGLFLISFFLKSKKASMLFLLYAILGLIGLPIYSSGGGFDYIFKPSFGFIIGFIFSAFIIGLNKKNNCFWKNIILGLLGILILYFFGVTYMYLVFKYYLEIDKSVIQILNLAVIPFILKDFISLFIAAVIYSRINHIYIIKSKKELEKF